MNKQQPTRAASLLECYALPPEEIEQRSLEQVEPAIAHRFSDAGERAVATRIVYAAGDLDLARQIRISAGAVAAGVEAARRGASILTDVRMVLSGISRAYAGALGCRLQCAIDDDAVAERARASGLPRAAEAIRALAGDLDGGIAVIGNAPTALLSLLDLTDAGVARPALVIGMPVGFVAAAEAKRELAARTLPFVTIDGTRGGSPLATAAINAILRLAAPKQANGSGPRTAILFVGHGSRAEGSAEVMAASIARIRRLGVYSIVEGCFLELAKPSLAEGLRACVEQGATHVAVVPYFLHRGMHIRRDIPALLRSEAGRYAGLRVSLGIPIGMQADLADVMIAGARAALDLPDIRDLPACTGACASGGSPQPCCDASSVAVGNRQ